MTKLSLVMIVLAIIYMVNSRSTTMNEGNEMSLSIEAKAYDHKSDTGIQGSLHLNNGQKSVSGEDNSEDDTSQDGNTKEDCEAPIVIAIVSVQPSKASYKHGEYIEYVCAGGVPDVNAVMKQRCNNGKFEPEANIRCRVSCTNLPTISGNGTLSTGNDGIWNLGESVQLTCDEGYSVSGPTMSTCGNAGFAPSTLICQKEEKKVSDEDISRLERSVDLLTGKLNASQEDIVRLERDVTVVTEQKKQTEEDISRLQRNMDLITGRLNVSQADLERNLDYAADQLNITFQEMLDCLKTELTNLNEQKKVSEKNISRLERNMDLLTGKFNASQEDFSRLGRNVDLVKGKLNASQNEVTRLKEYVTTHTGQLNASHDDLERSLGFATNKLNITFQEMLDCLKAELTNLNEQKKQTEEDIIRLDRNMDLVTGKVNTSEKNIARLEENITFVTGKCNASQEDVARLERNVDLVTGRLNASMGESERALVSVTNQLNNTLYREVDTLKTELNNLNEQKKESQEDISRLDRSVNLISGKVTASERGISQLERSVNSLTGRVTASERGISQLEQNWASITERLTVSQRTLGLCIDNTRQLRGFLTFRFGDITVNNGTTPAPYPA